MTRFDDEDRISGLASLRDVTPPPSLVPAVMRRIAEPQPVTFWSWLRKPRRLELRLSPLSFLTMGLTAAALVVMVTAVTSGFAGRDRSRFVVQVTAPVASSPERPQDAAVVVRFTLVAQGAHKVALAGDFNNWDPSGTLLVPQDGNGTFAATVRLPPGAHEYMFVVDGKWVTDPAAAEKRPDGFGRDNAVLRL
jgi:hypothetical protein